MTVKTKLEQAKPVARVYETKQEKPAIRRYKHGMGWGSHFTIRRTLTGYYHYSCFAVDGDGVEFLVETGSRSTCDAAVWKAREALKDV